METRILKKQGNREKLCFFKKTGRFFFMEFLFFYGLNSSLKLYNSLHILIIKVGMHRTYLLKLEFKQKPRVFSLKMACCPSYRTGCRCSYGTCYCSCRMPIAGGWMKAMENYGLMAMVVTESLLQLSRQG